MLEMKVPKDGVIKFNELERGQMYFISFEKPVVISIRGVKIFDIGNIRLINVGEFISLTLFSKGVVICTTEFNHNQQLKRDDYYKPTEVFVLEKHKVIDEKKETEIEKNPLQRVQ